MKSLIVPILATFLSFATSDPLNVDDFSDGDCTRPPPAHNFSSVLPLFATPQVYVSYLMSKSCALRYYETYNNGNQAPDWTAVNNICYNIMFVETLAVQSGYNQTKAWIDHALPDVSYTTSPGVFIFTNTLQKSAGVNPANQENTLQTTVWSDGSKHSLTVRCVNNSTQDWILYSVGTPEPWAKDLVLKKVTDLGMDAGNFVEFKTCTDPPAAPQYTLNVLSALGIETPSLLNPLTNVLGILDSQGLGVLYQVLKPILPLLPGTG